MTSGRLGQHDDDAPWLLRSSMHGLRLPSVRWGTVAVLALVALIGAGAGYFLFHWQTLYRLYNSDIFHQLAVVKEFEAPDYRSIGDPFFAGGPVDLHAGPYYFLLHVLGVVTGLSTYDVMLVAALGNIVLIALGLAVLANSLSLSSGQTLTLIAISFFGWGAFGFFFAGIYEFTNLLATGSLPASMGVGFILMILGFTRQYLRTARPSFAVLIGLCSSVLLVSHLLSGVILYLLLGLCLGEHVLVHRRLTTSARWLLLTLLAALGLSLFIWPLFNLLTLLRSSSTVQVGDSDKVTVNFFTISAWPSLLGTTLVGAVFLPYAYRSRKYFLVALTVVSALITASYLYPIRISLYWRFLPFIFLGLSLTFALYLGRLHRVAASLVLALALVWGGLNARTKIQTLISRPVSDPSELSQPASQIPRDAVVLTDPNTAFHLAALHHVRVVAVPYNHANPAYIRESKQRYEDTIAFFMDRLSPAEQQALVERYAVDYVLINQDYFPDFIRLGNDRSWLGYFQLQVPAEVVLTNRRFTLYQLKPHAPGA